MALPTYGTRGGVPDWFNVPIITVLINGHPFLLELDTGESGIIITRTALTAAGLHLPCSASKYAFRYGDGSETSGCIASARVGLPGYPAVTMNIALDTGGKTDAEWPIGDVAGDFGGGMSFHTLGLNASPPVDTPDYVRAAGYAGFVLDCTSAPPSGGDTRRCLFQPRNRAPSNAVPLPMDTHIYPYAQWTPVKVTFGTPGSHQLLRQEVFDTGTNTVQFDPTIMKAAMRDPDPWDAVCTFNGIPTARAGIAFSASAGPVNLGFTTQSACDDGTPGTQDPMTRNDWLLRPPPGMNPFRTRTWGMPLMLGHALWFSPHQVDWLR